MPQGESVGWAAGLALILELATGCTSGLTATSPAVATVVPPQAPVAPASLAEMFAAIRQQNLSLDSVLIIRHGYVVAETYYPPFQPERKHPIHSITKSIISALVGIALDQGYLFINL